MMIRLTRAQMREIDRRSIEHYRIPGVVLMENASRAVADNACDMLGGDCVGEILIICGGGNNGGDGLAAARHLHNRGLESTLFLAIAPSKYRGEALTNWQIVDAMRIPRLEAFDEMMRREWDLVIDAVFGTGLAAAPRNPEAGFIETINSWRTKVLAVDLPSGLDCDTGKP